jgi:hypothetical protein
MVKPSDPGELETSKNEEIWKAVATMETNVAGNVYGELWTMLNQVYWAMVRAAENELRKVGLSMIQAAVLFLVKGAQEPVTPAKLSRWLFREPHTVSGLLNREKKQLTPALQQDACSSQ